jgi:hypothetical protein
MIAPDSVRKVVLGNGQNGFITGIDLEAEFRVYAPNGNITDCVLELRTDVPYKEWDCSIYPKSRLRKVNCESLPNLKIFETGQWCSTNKQTGGLCTFGPEIGRATTGNTFMVYYDDMPRSVPAGISDDNTITGQGAFEFQSSQDLAPSAAPGVESGDDAPAASTPVSSAASYYLLKAPYFIFYAVVSSVAVGAF